MSLKRTFYQTTYTAIPAHIPRQLAIDLLHNHSEIIELNPLVIGHHAIQAPPKAPADEYYSTWYDIQQRIQLIPGTGKVGSSKISFNGVFHDLPNGLQTHIYAPGGIDLRHNYSIAGNQPGEPPQVKELGSGAPSSGLYLKEDIEIRCNMVMINFVKKELRSATDVLTARLVKKAELIDAGILHAMMDEGRLKTINPANRASTFGAPSPGLSAGFPQSPRSSLMPYPSPRLPTEGGNFTAELQGSQAGVRQSQFGQPSPRGLGFELPADKTYPAELLPTNSQPSGSQPSTNGTSYYEMSGDSAPHSQPSQSTDRTSYYEMSGEPSVSQQDPGMDARSYREPSAEQRRVSQPSMEGKAPEWKSSDRLSHQYYGSERIQQIAKKSSWEPDDDKK